MYISNRYIKGRPDYTHEAVEEVGRLIRESIEGSESNKGLLKMQNLGLSDIRILELGAGTGKQFVAYILTIVYHFTTILTLVPLILLRNPRA